MKKYYSSYEEEDAYRKGYYGRYRDYEYEEYSDRARDRAYFDGIKEQEQEKREQRELMERQEQEEMIHQRYVEEKRQREQEEQIQEEQQYWHDGIEERELQRTMNDIEKNLHNDK